MMSLRWSPPKLIGGALIIGYEYRTSVDIGSSGLPAPLAAANVSRATVPCLAPAAGGHGCTYEVRATNGTAGAWSVAVGTTWIAPSYAVLGKSVGGPGVHEATLQWRVPKTSGGLEISYQYTVDAGSGFTGPFTIDPSTITSVPALTFPVLTATVPCVPTTAMLACTYVMTAVNAAGASTASRPRRAPFRHPTGPTNLLVHTSSVALGTGSATQAISWDSPLNLGGLPPNDYIVVACTTSSGSTCSNLSAGWTQFADLTGNPLPTTAMHDCQPNGRCAYEVWAKNQLGKGWVWGYAGTGGPTILTASSVPGHVDLQWLNPVDTGTFGNYVLFECNLTASCSNGSWTNVAGDAAPWTRVDLFGMATSTTGTCAVGVQCIFRVGYVDADGNIGGVSNAVTVSGQ
jgi:hypothetical protein